MIVGGKYKPIGFVSILFVYLYICIFQDVLELNNPISLTAPRVLGL